MLAHRALICLVHRRRRPAWNNLYQKRPIEVGDYEFRFSTYKLVPSAGRTELSCLSGSPWKSTQMPGDLGVAKVGPLAAMACEGGIAYLARERSFSILTRGTDDAVQGASSDLP